METPEQDTPQFEDAIEMLKADHHKVRHLFQEYMAASEQKAQRQIAEQVFVELETHAQLEEMVFYPAFEAATDEEGQQLIEDARQDHQTVRDLIKDLRTLDDEEEFDASFRELMDHVESHVQDEEANMFPEAEELLADQDAELMDEMEEIKERLLAS
jgi:hemerythrin superfamily protein